MADPDAGAGGTAPARPAVHELLFLILLASIPFARLTVARTGGLAIIATDVIFVAAFAAWGLAVLRGRAVLHRTRLYLPLAAYALALVASALASEAPRRSMLKAASIFYLIALAVLAYNLTASRRRFVAAAKATLLASGTTVALSSLGVVLFYLGLRSRSVNLVLWNYGSLPPGNYPRLQGFFANGNMLCNYLIVAAMLALWARAVGYLSQRLFVALAAALIVTATFTISPGLGGLALSVGLWWYLRTRTSASPLGKLALAGGLAAALGFIVISSVELGRGPLRPSVRLLVWRGSFQTFLQHPLFGRGVGTEATAIDYVNLAGLRERLSEAHNIWLSVAAQEGILGLLAFGSIIGWLLWRWRRGPALDEANAAARTALGCALVGAVLMQGLTGALEDARHVWVLIGMMGAAVDGWRREGDAPNVAG